MQKRAQPKLNYLWIARKQVGLAQKSVARLLGHKTTSVITEVFAAFLHGAGFLF